MISPAPTMVMSARELDMTKALCRTTEDLEPDDFHVDDEDKKQQITKRAVALCRTEPCPIIFDCARFGYVNNLSGIWGGTTSKERETLRRQERRRKAGLL